MPIRESSEIEELVGEEDDNDDDEAEDEDDGPESEELEAEGVD